MVVVVVVVVDVVVVVGVDVVVVVVVGTGEDVDESCLLFIMTTVGTHTQVAITQIKALK